MSRRRTSHRTHPSRMGATSAALSFLVLAVLAGAAANAAGVPDGVLGFVVVVIAVLVWVAAGSRHH